MNAITDAVHALETLVIDFSWRRTFIAILLVVVVTCAIVGAEWYTGYFQLGRLERATVLLERLAALDQKVEIQSSQALKAMKDRLVSDLNVLVIPAAGGAQAVPPFANTRQFVAGALPWLLFSLLWLSDLRKGDDSAPTIIGVAVFLAVAFGALAAVMPNTWTSVPILAAFALGPIAIVVAWFVLRRGQRRRAKDSLIAAE